MISINSKRLYHHSIPVMSTSNNNNTSTGINPSSTTSTTSTTTTTGDEKSSSSSSTNNRGGNNNSSNNQEPPKKKKKGYIKKFFKYFLLGAATTSTILLILGSFFNYLDMTDINDDFLVDLEEQKQLHQQPEKQTFLQLLSKAIPTNFISRCWGNIGSTELRPEILRPLVYNAYGWFYNVNMEEIEKPLEEYASLQDFFSRKLKPTTRPSLSVQHKRKILRKIHLDENADLNDIEREYQRSLMVSPVDGTVARFGTLSVELDQLDETYEHIYLPQVKGVTYSMQQLLQKEKSQNITFNNHFSVFSKRNGYQPQQDEEITIGEEYSEHDQAAVSNNNQNTKQKKQLHYCVLYLAPGDYHRFHSPCDMTVESRKHIYGKLYPVMPLYLNKYPNLYTQNERVVLNGKWDYGNMHYVIVGALNVGSCVVNFDNSLRTNKTKPSQPAQPTQTEKVELVDKKTKEEHIKDPEQGEEVVVLSRNYVQGGLSIEKGEELGYFKLGSTIILIFESNEEDRLEFNLHKGQKVRLGDTILQKKNE
ncbi:phosphatidylserine decarboxylase [Naegleria gruberi]|uniref:phosphatidylserine decarboxylase n=1 Tax=Naegleria gruberi TaxID=5762 RepID=D2VGU6_NAEGR|nr:phosphatidylserine decarboxylase [Naegleria gruberi]EFC44122.1 phosphatidylserine decarboxylase [Naegleria gruberi]|eukprot:XP_002676866.1 phosphatidylserine decarboxylase [Naegleria gruberi strain NEG-M]